MRGPFVGARGACFYRAICWERFPAKIGGALIASSVGMLALSGVAPGVWLYPDATFDFVVKAAGYAGVMLLGSAVRRSKPFQTFVIACVLLLLVALLPIMLRAGHVGIALAIWNAPLSGTGFVAHDPWRSDREKDGT
jgi:hypothetical protein